MPDYEFSGAGRTSLDRGENAVRQGPPSPFNMAGETLDRAAALASRACNLADRLCGERPPSPTSKEGSGRSSRPGLFGAVELTCGNVNDLIDAANTALSRIENELP